MSESNNAKDERSGGVLANRLFSGAVAKKVGEHLTKASEDLSRGATDQANEHLRRVGQDLPKLLTNLTSPNLSEAENEEWLKLQQQKYKVTDRGMIWINMLDEGREVRIKFLGNKAFGKE